MPPSHSPNGLIIIFRFFVSITSFIIFCIFSFVALDWHTINWSSVRIYFPSYGILSYNFLASLLICFSKLLSGTPLKIPLSPHFILSLWFLASFSSWGTIFKFNLNDNDNEKVSEVFENITNSFDDMEGAMTYVNA